MQPLLLTALDAVSSWAKLESFATAMAALIALVAALLTWHGLRISRQQDLASRVDALLTMMGTGEIAEARSTIYMLATAQVPPKEGEQRPPDRCLTPDEFDRVFKLLWALQRVSVLAPVIRRSGEASIEVLADQISRMTYTFRQLGQILSPADKIAMAQSRKTTLTALESLERALSRSYDWSNDLSMNWPDPPKNESKTIAQE